MEPGFGEEGFMEVMCDIIKEDDNCEMHMIILILFCTLFRYNKEKYTL